MEYTYECQNTVKNLKDDQPTKVEHGKYFYMICNECCNVPVAHLLTRNNEND